MPSAVGLAGDVRSRSSSDKAVLTKATDSGAMAVQNGEKPQTNGVYPRGNGSLINGLSPKMPEIQQQGPCSLRNCLSQLPPEIEHITIGYRPISSVISRLVQETFNGLQDVISDMADKTMPQPQPNGIINHANHRGGIASKQDTSLPNVQKKITMFDFANSRRAQFIKMLVLSRWARQAEAISTVIDLRVWLAQKQTDYSNAAGWMGELKRKLANLKEPAPDIKTALEVLSLGKASWIPDLAYLPKEFLSSTQILGSLRKINTLLSIRLHLHENIPSNLRNFSVSSGRVTFLVEEEFEVDLSIADEDFSKQLYFIDLRLAFSPTPRALPAGRLKDEFEAKSNDVLGREGLIGLFDYTHNIIMTQKLAILRNQAVDMAKGYWSEHLKVESLRRSVVVQYWCERQGAKHWIELGIARGKAKRIAWADEEQRIPRIAIRWFRAGREVPNVQIDLRLGEISLQYILEQIIARHISFDLSEIATKLGHGDVYSSGRLRSKVKESLKRPSEACLMVQLTASKAIKLTQEPISGRFAILPSSSLNSRAEYELNRLAVPANESAHQISYLRALIAHEEVTTSASRMGWESLPTLRPNQEVIQKLFPPSTQKVKFYRRSSWVAGWAVAFSTSINGDQWWVAETSDSYLKGDIRPPNADGISLNKVYNIALGGFAAPPVNTLHLSLAEIERSAAGTISQYCDSRYLASAHTPHKIQPTTSLSVMQQHPSIYIQLPTKQEQSGFGLSVSPNTPWSHELVKLDYRGLNSTHSSAVHLASTRLSQPLPNLKDLAASIPGAAFHPSTGAFALQVLTKVGQSAVPQLRQRIGGIGRLHGVIATLKAYKLLVTRITVSSLDFTYLQTPKRLRATIHFPADGPLRISLSHSSPHLRILDHLNARFRSHGLTKALCLMQTTLSLLFTFSNLESAQSSSNINILSRSEEWYQVCYSAPSPVGGYDVQLRRRRDQPMWLIPEDTIKPSSVYDAAQDIRRGKGNGWRGVKGGIIAELNGVHDVVKKLDDVFSQFTKHVAEQSNTRKRKAEGNVVEID